MKNIHESVNNGFCNYAKELWCNSTVKGCEILITQVTRVCELDGVVCGNWNNGQAKNCPTLQQHEFWERRKQ